MPLDLYRKKRRFNGTPEPVGGVHRQPGGTRIFVVQKHQASRLHYDFRLEIGGVLVSWAIPKGPSLNATDKRLAARTENHPMEYADFEGVIPEGNYGAGTVMVWDRGTYEPEDGGPPEEQLAGGEIKAVLHGKKLRGGFVLVHLRRLSFRSRGKSQWLLIKRRDEYANASWRIDDPGSSLGVWRDKHRCFAPLVSQYRQTCGPSIPCGLERPIGQFSHQN